MTDCKHFKKSRAQVRYIGRCTVMRLYIWDEEECEACKKRKGSPYHPQEKESNKVK